jgi:hypothetical protein
MEGEFSRIVNKDDSEDSIDDAHMFLLLFGRSRDRLPWHVFTFRYLSSFR